MVENSSEKGAGFMTCGNKGVLRREGRCHPTTVIFMGLKTKRPASSHALHQMHSSRGIHLVLLSHPQCLACSGNSISDDDHEDVQAKKEGT